MVTIEVLQKSQPTRPRKWIPVVCFIMLILTLAGAALMTVYLFPNWAISQKVLSFLPNKAMSIGKITSLKELMTITIVPGGLILIDLFALIFTAKMCKYRRVYWWFGWVMIVGFIATVLLTIFFNLYYLVPMIANFIDKIPASIFNLLRRLFRYGVLACTAAFALVMLFGVFYNVNYPAKYEEIYALRKDRLKSYETGSERSAYRKRFYQDYKNGNWVSMMRDLHYRAFIKDTLEPMRADSYEFFVNYCCDRDATLRHAMFDQYAKEGRFYELRQLFHDIDEKSDVIDRGGKVVIPHYVPEPSQPRRRIRIPARAKVAPAPAPLAPQGGKPSTNPKTRKWAPEDI